MLVLLWLSGLSFAVLISSGSSSAYPRVRLRDAHGRLRSQTHPVFVTAKDSPLHISRFPLNKHGHESFMMPRRTPGGEYIVDDGVFEELLTSQNNRAKFSKIQPDIEPTAEILKNRDSDVENRLSSLINPYDIAKLLAKLSSVQGPVKTFEQHRQRAKKSKRNPKRLKLKSNKNKYMDSVNLNPEVLVAMMKNGANSENERNRKFKKIPLKNVPEGMTVSKKKFNWIPHDVPAEIKVNALNELLKRAIKARQVNKFKTKNTKNGRHKKKINSKKDDLSENVNEQTQSSPFDSQGMMFITKPKEKREPNLNTLIEKVVDMERTGPGRTHSLRTDFSPDEIQQIQNIAKAIKDGDRSFEQINESVENLDQQIQGDDLGELQKVKDQILLPKYVQTDVDPNADDSTKYFGRIARQLQARDDNKDPVFEFDALVA